MTSFTIQQIFSLRTKYLIFKDKLFTLKDFFIFKNEIFTFWDTNFYHEICYSYITFHISI